MRRTRVRGKQRAPAHYMLSAPAFQALADEAWSEVAALADDARRKHVHWVHVRTANPEHKQPSSFTREEFYLHLSRCYKDVYPEPANSSGSILLFGMVAKEKHAAAAGADRDEHHHCPCYTSLRHYWAPVARRSLELGVKLHAARHEGYTTMYVYVTCPSPRKPLAELDAAVWFSPDHPRGEVLQRLLAVGNRSVLGLARKQTRQGNGAVVEQAKRFRPTDVYAFVAATGVRTVGEMLQRAHAEAAVGHTRLAEFCTTHRPEDVQQYLSSAWSVHEAPQRALESDPDRIAKLRRAAETACVCGGFWVPGITYVLQNNHEDGGQFCSDVLRALTLGARRGVNMAISGPPGCGKSTVFEAMDLIFRVCAKPPGSDGKFALAGVIGAEVLLWQEFVWEPQMRAFEDLLALMASERVGIRRPRQEPEQYKNRAPMFYTAWQPLTYSGREPQKMIVYNQAMGERFKTRRWTVPLPQEGRLQQFPQCAHCFATWLLTNGRQ